MKTFSEYLIESGSDVSVTIYVPESDKFNTDEKLDNYADKLFKIIYQYDVKSVGVVESDDSKCYIEILELGDKRSSFYKQLSDDLSKQLKKDGFNNVVLR
ncbi:hypothetical protein RE654_09295 [Aeromonas caviae]|uniref:hypothetical protein n=1 Tax=Aeromonas caviae TaxID=648 RepID=UPI00214D8A46|nr:hypothetical protein [Aeromonas caviae]MCR3947749.1 hypothetical protein [Aeromonas caviae]WMX36386.1 hypothetical protein RE654_09295 [Aeromonas caviae]